MKLVVVESPHKAQTIEKYLGKDFKVIASYGHIRDLPKSNKNAVDIEHGFIPKYVIPKDKKEVVKKLKEEIQKADEAYLATDPDREGEAIAWHIVQTCDGKNPKRITFHEITKDAILNALKHPSELNKNLVKAQEARRVLDRLFGYDLSGLIWKKVRYGLSAGRVQSPALRIIVEREREIREFKPEKYFVLEAILKTKNGEKINFTCSKQPKTQKETDEIINTAKENSFYVKEVEQTEAKRSPRPPFITSTLQQAASSQLGFTPAKTMLLAQRLYEKGLITYMRTDSTTLSKEAKAKIAEKIKSKFGKDYLKIRDYKTKTKNAQEAHEAIRPTDINLESAGSSDDEKKLYKLIWKRTVASQMQDAKILKTKIISNIKSNTIPDFYASGSVILFDGWLKANPESKSEDTILPKVNKGDELILEKITKEEKETKPKPRYTEAGLVKELEKRGIGRPSTYASIIKTLFDRHYVVKEGKTLKPTDTGEIVSTFLENNFKKYISDTFTAEMEQELDDISNGIRDYEGTLKEFYIPFSKEIKDKEKIEKLTTLGKADEKFKCPKCGSNMVIKLGKRKKFLSCEKFPECLGVRTLEGEEIKEPEKTGEKCPECGGDLVERNGRYGKFISCSNYPKCRYIKEDEKEKEKRKTGVKCPECKDGEIVERRGRFGAFYSCSNYPKCKFSMKARPTGNTCKECGSLMMEGTKTIPERCSNKNCKYHNPHKIK